MAIRRKSLKFLIKLEDAANQFILKCIKKINSFIPEFVFVFFSTLKNLPFFFKKKIHLLEPKINIFIRKTIGYFQHYTTLLGGHFIGLIIYLKSEEFKKRNKIEMCLVPIRKFKTDPILVLSVLSTIAIFGTMTFFVFKNTEKIITGTKALRSPASMEMKEEPILEFKKLKYTLLGKDVYLNVVVLAESIEERDKLLPIEKKIREHLLGLHFYASSLPLSPLEREGIKSEIKKAIVGAKIKDVEVTEILPARPKYFMQTEKLTSFRDLNLQLFLEDTKRNRQVWIDFTSLSSNRNIVLFLNDHRVEVFDYLNMHVEPIIPHLPIEEEGRLIIKEKIRLELNNLLKEHKIEGKILEIYINYLIVS